MNTQAMSGRRIAGWAGLLAAPLGLFNIATFLSVTNGNTEALLDPAYALALPASAQAVFTASMVADTLGFYLLPAMLGGYLATCLPAAQRARAALASPCLLVFAVLGILGALLQMAALPALAAAHAAGMPGAEAAWVVIVNTAQNGLWWFEMLPFGIYALLCGSSLRAAKFGFGSLLIAGGVLGLLYWVLTIPGVASVVPGAAMGAETAGLLALLTILAWAFLTGWTMLRKDAGALDAAALAKPLPQANR
ncbi:hypothetical protein [Variovorax sp. dw_308]|uniref:hypothetical protein n=1 Tax=Variovorax sp. dw_308 TaxID=2721546 RepID=UPI001C495868|nr:hypothetical protein [Variovorax sp. dw_308]